MHVGLFRGWIAVVLVFETVNTGWIELTLASVGKNVGHVIVFRQYLVLFRVFNYSSRPEVS